MSIEARLAELNVKLPNPPASTYTRPRLDLNNSNQWTQPE
jgi:hypothetical protein